MSRIVAIHQPTFLPWLGWWDKFVRSDVFVLLDEVQFPKKGGTWMNRVRLLRDGKAAWVTVPVDRSFHGVRSVREMRVDDKKPWRGQIASTIASSYGAAPHFDAVYPVIEDVLHAPTDRVAEVNEAAVRRLAANLDLDASKLVRQSDLAVAGTGTDLLVALCHAAGGDAYLSGDGAGEYLEEAPFADAGVELMYQRFVLSSYPQASADWIPGLSIVDTLMSCGWSGTRALIDAGRGRITSSA